MTLLRDLKARRELVRARVQPGLWFTGFSPRNALERVRCEYFSEVSQKLAVYSVKRGPLACVFNDNSSATIFVHQVLNHSDLPVEVFDFICKHELLHLRIRPVVTGERTIDHPPEFWEAEKAIAPERRLIWGWIRENLWDCLKERRDLERIDVRPRWIRTWNRSFRDLAEIQELLRAMTKEVEELIW